MMLNIATPSDQGISFSRGEILQGSVQEVRADGLVMMFLKGRLIEAATEVMVKPGQQLFLMVDDFHDGKTFLKVLSPERMVQLENANLSANLQSMGIPVKDETVLFARKLLQHNLPVTPHNLNEMQKGINVLGANNPGNLEIVTLALSRGLPLNQQVLNALLQFTDPGSNLSKLLKNLIQNLTQLSRQVGDESSQPVGRYNHQLNLSPVVNRPILAENIQQNSSLSNSERPVIQSGQGLSGKEVQYVVETRPGTQTTVAGNTSLPTVSELVRDTSRVPVQVNIMQPDGDEGSTINRPAAGRTGQQFMAERPVFSAAAITASIEERQAGTLNRPTAKNLGQQFILERPAGGLIADSQLLSSGGDKISSLTTGIRTDLDGLKFLALIRPLLEVLQIELSNNPAVTREGLQNWVQSENELVRGLILLQDLIKDGEIVSKLPLISELLNRVEGMERELSGQRIFNYLSRMPDSNFNYYYFSFPVKIDDEYRLCQMRVNREAGNKLLKEQDNINFIVSLDTANMGMVLFHINWNKNKTLALQGVVESDKVMHYFNKHINQLIKGLNQLGYTINNLGVRRVKEDEEIDKLRPQMEEVPMKIRPFSIDVTV
jgi:hypothetical protein